MKRILVALLMLTALLACQEENDTQKPTDPGNTEAAVDSSAVTVPGQSVPDFTVTTLTGTTYQMAGLRGKVVWLNFFATWCPPCKEEMPELQNRVWEVYGQRDDFLLLSIGREETPEKMIPFRDERGLTFPMAPDTDRSVYARFAEKFIPRNVLIDKNGTIIHQSKGFEAEDFATLLAKTQKALN